MPKRRHALPVLLLAALALPARARPVVLELFTSQGCSSCPPADALLGRVQAGSADILALSFHVTYWNGVGWTDPFSLAEATSRQRTYAHALGSEVFTPQLVVDGQASVVGSDRKGLLAAVAHARQAQAAGPAISVNASQGNLEATIGAGSGEATLLLVGFDSAHSTQIRGGENGGVRLDETHVVRSLRALGAWHGAPLQLKVAAPAGERVALILQREDGGILGAASN